MVGSVLRIVVKQFAECVQVVLARHRHPVQAEVVGQLVDQEERSLVAVAAQHYGTVFELCSAQQHVRPARQEDAIDHWEERELDYAARDPLLVDDERRRLRAQTCRHLGV